MVGGDGGETEGETTSAALDGGHGLANVVRLNHRSLSRTPVTSFGRVIDGRYPHGWGHHAPEEPPANTQLAAWSLLDARFFLVSVSTSGIGVPVVAQEAVIHNQWYCIRSIVQRVVYWTTNSSKLHSN